ncbi:MAG: hypothetical protein LUG99_00490 [Lachnospiraceae bacterium]|nr:hypothetical protein [Lachnospiraceae bacterium]
MGNSGNSGMNKLARVISQRASQVSSQTGGDLVLDFGTILKDYSLRTDTFPIPIPRSDYYACSNAPISKGNRVLVAWVQNDVVVIDAVGKR